MHRLSPLVLVACGLVHSNAPNPNEAVAKTGRKLAFKASRTRRSARRVAAMHR
jgi:hypothetical protein